MILGMTTATYTILHVVISLIGIGSGVVVLWGMIRGKRLEGITKIVLASTVLTSVTGFGFPFDHLSPAHKVGILSLVLLAVAILARYPLHLAGPWRWAYVVCASMALYLNVFVFVIQSFEKSSLLRSMAPTQHEPPFVITQLAVLLAFVGLTILAGKKFRLEPLHAPASAA